MARTSSIDINHILTIYQLPFIADVSYQLVGGLNRWATPLKKIRLRQLGWLEIPKIFMEKCQIHGNQSPPTCCELIRNLLPSTQFHHLRTQLSPAFWRPGHVKTAPLWVLWGELLPRPRKTYWKSSENLGGIEQDELYAKLRSPMINYDKLW